MSTNTQPRILEPAASHEPPYEGFDWGGQLQLCQALRVPEVREALGMAALCFDQLAWAPRVGDRPLGALQVEQLRGRFAFYAARHGQPSWRASLDEVRAALRLVASELPMHPIAQRLAELRWDGETRLARVATEILGVDPKEAPHAAQVVRKWFLATTARAFRPGCSVDGVLTLVGDGPVPPAMFFRLLVPPGEFADAPVAIDSDEMAATLRSAWICVQNDFPLRAAKDPGAVAAFLSRTTDEVQDVGLPEGERALRTTVFGAAVSAMPPLDDDALRRRFQVIPVRQLDPAKLETWAEQLWAEAAAAFVTGASWRLTPAEEVQDARAHRAHAIVDPWEAPLLEFMTRKLNHDDDIKSAPNMAKILAEVFGMRDPKLDVPASMRVAKILKRHGFRSRLIRIGLGRTRVWYPDWLEDDGTDDIEE